MDINATPGQPTEQTVQTPVVESTPQPTGTPQTVARTELYNKIDNIDYSSLYPQTTPEPTPPVAKPAEVTLPDPPPIDAARISQLEATIEELRKQIPTPTPATPPPAPTVHPMQQWVELMSQNKLDEAEQFFLDNFAPKIAAKLQPQMVEQSVAANRAEVEIERFVTQFETSNADLMPMKDYVVLGAERRLQAAQNEGKIKSPADFVQEYKKAVTDEANALREKFQMARGAGKEEAMNATRSVLSATTLSPSPMSAPQTSSKQEPSTPADYLAMRRGMLANRMGLGTT